MSSDNNDFFGGMFDFNGDGKTTFDEELLAYKMYQDMTGENSSGTRGSYRPAHSTVPDAKPYIPAAPVVPPKAASAPLTKENYHQRRGSLWLSILVTFLTGLGLSILPVLFMWAPIASYEPNPYCNNSYSYLIALLIFFGGGAAVLGAIWKVFFESICQDFKDLRRLKKEYKKLLQEDR